MDDEIKRNYWNDDEDRKDTGVRHQQLVGTFPTFQKKAKHQKTRPCLFPGCTELAYLNIRGGSISKYCLDHKEEVAHERALQRNKKYYQSKRKP